MKERPILFTGPMVRAILDGRKTQTRRVVKCPKLDFMGQTPFESEAECWDTGYTDPDGQPVALSDLASPFWNVQRLWVKETFSYWCHSVESVGIEYAAGGEDKIVDFPGKVGMPPLETQCQKNIGGGRRKRPSIFMPRWASRITLEITGVRVERVQDISLKDALAEGVHDYSGDPDQKMPYPKEVFRILWDSINLKRGFGWDKNPWVWVISFKIL